MSSALPVVATAVGGIPEQVEDHGSGFLVRAGDTEAMLARVRALVVDDALRRETGGRGREIVLERFRLDLQVDAYLHWYQEILERRGAEGGT
jgi:glycosyltransferase involved in cell wall biosynthesis